MRHLDLQAGQEFNQLVDQIPSWSGWLATLVSTSDGLLIGPDGSSKGVGNQLDLQLLLALRSKADVICTTGQTARLEKYKSSRFAPLAFLTRSKDSLSELPAVLDSGAHQNLFLVPPPQANLYNWANEQLENRGFSSILYEGGPTTLEQLWGSSLPVQLVFSIANCDDPAAIDTHRVVSKALPWFEFQEPIDDFGIGSNRVLHWLNSST